MSQQLMLCKAWFSPRHQHKYDGSEDASNRRRMDNYYILSAIPPRYRETRWRTYTSYAFRSVFSLDISISTRRKYLSSSCLYACVVGLLTTVSLVLVLMS